MAIMNKTQKLPKAVGGNIIIKGIEKCKTEGGIYLPGQSAKTDKRIYNREFYIHQIGPNVDESVNTQLKAGDEVFVNWIPTIHPIISDVNAGREDEDYVFYFGCRPADVVCTFEG
jgi:co-chaperonin GroES (HSP10)